MSAWLPRPTIASRRSSVVLAYIGHYNGAVLPGLVAASHQHRSYSHSPVQRPSATRLPALPTAYPSYSRSVSTTPKKEDESPSPSADDKAVSKDEPKPPLATRVWTKVKHEAAHYYDGSKLLVSEVRISSRLLLKLMRGANLTRRENRQVRLLREWKGHFQLTLSTAQADHDGLVTPNPFLGLRGSSVHGAVASCCN